MKKVVVLVLFLLGGILFFSVLNIGNASALCPETYPEGMVFCYGFEDWTGDAETTPNYFSSTGYQSYWEDHITGTEVIQSGNPDCGGREAHTGDYYFHQGFYTQAEDPCLGTVPDSINPHTNIGLNEDYPSDPKNNFKLIDSAISGTLTVRTYFRVTGAWPNDALDNGNKFMRVAASNMGSCQLISVSDDGTTIDIYDHPTPTNTDPSWSDYHNVFTSPVNWNDGEWHSISVVFDSYEEPLPNGDVLNVTVWVDDWDMEGEPVGNANTYDSDCDGRWGNLEWMVNWDAESPDSMMGIDFDDIEIWDGIPDSSHTSTECTSGQTRDCDTGLSGICASGTETCVNGSWNGSCVQDNESTTEICDNGLDDDCDGLIDSEDSDCDTIQDKSQGNGTLLIDYGFEDWTGSQDTTPGYLFSTDYEEYWNIHKAGTEVIQECNGRTAYEGDYFWRKQFANDYVDDCLGTTTLNENTHNTMGYDGTYPVDSGDSVVFSEDVKSNIMTYRMRVRIPDPIYDHWPGMKFLTQRGNIDDSVYFNLGWDSSNPENGYLRPFAYPDEYVNTTVLENISDGNWHSLVFKIGIQAENEVNFSVWYDDWNMSSEPITKGKFNNSEFNFGNGFAQSVLVMNYGGSSHPNDPMALEFDNIQIWDGIPSNSDNGTSENQTLETHPADLNRDGVISLAEIQSYIDSWLSEEITIDELLSGINEWREL